MVCLSLLMIFWTWDSRGKFAIHRSRFYDVKTTSLCKERAKCYMCFCAFPFGYRSTDVIANYRSSESFPSLVADWKQLVEITLNFSSNCFCFRFIFVHQCLQFHIFEFFAIFPCSLSATSTSLLLKRLNHCSHILRCSMFTINFSKKSIWFRNCFLLIKTKD